MEGIIVNKLRYGCGTLACYQHECDDLEVMQNVMGRWHWDVWNVKNEMIRGETGWGIYEEIKANAMVKWMWC